tara:strand:+ start:2514 stop:6707 length:4194 start_codon:yes stop_codon:yes gene_type:complete
MTEIFDLDYSGSALREQIENWKLATNNHLDVARPEAAGAWETAGLIWQQETMIGSMITYGFSKDRNQLHYEYDKSFNPIRMWHKNQDKYGDISGYIRQGMFNDVVSEQQFLDRRERLLDEQERRQRIADGSGWGMLMGMGLSLVDIATLIPLGGWVTKGNTLAKIGKMAVAGSTLTAAQEAVLHMQQDLRTADESFMNIGIAAPIGGGFGLFASALNPKSRLNPKHPENPFHKDNKIRMGVAQFGQSISESAIIQPAKRGAGKTFEIVRDSSVGAATVKVGQVVKAGVVTKPLKLLNKATPVGRMLYAKSAKAREVGQKLFDIGGILTDMMATGQRVDSVEDWRGMFMMDYENTFFNSVARWNKLRMELEETTGGIPNETVQRLGDKARQAGRFVGEAVDNVRGRDTESAAKGKHFEDFEWQDIVYKSIFDDVDDATVKSLRDRFGDTGAERILSEAKEQAAEIHAMNKRMEDLMVAAVDENGNPMITESQRMGDEYGLAQLWNPKAMRGVNRKKAVAFFMEEFLDKPSDEFLEGLGMTIDDFAKLGREEVKIGDEVFNVERGLDKRTEILEEWSGDTYNRQVMEAEIALEVAEAALDTARKQAVWASRDLRRSETDYRKASVDEAKKILEHRIAERDRAIAEREKLSLERQAVDTEIRRLEAEQEARMNQFHQTGRWTRKYTAERTQDVEGAEGLLSHLENEAGGAPHADIQEARMLLTEADNQLAMVADDALDAAVADAATKPVYSRALDKLRERQRMLARQTNRVERRLDRLDPRISKLDEAVGAASEAVVRVREGRVKLREAKKEADKAKRAAQRDVKKGKKKVRRTDAKLPVHLYVEDLVDKLGKQNKLPRGILESEVFASGRTKDRQINLTNERRREAISLGLLRNDLWGVMYTAHEDIATRLAMRKVFGAENPDRIIAGVRDEYTSLAAQARNNKNLKNPEKRAQQLEKEGARMVKDIEGSWERMLGQHGLPDDPEGFIHWSLQKLRALNFIKYGTGFLISSLTDPASVALTSGFHALSIQNMRAVRQAMKGMRSDEIRRLATISERVLHNSRTLKIADVSDIRDMSGIGDMGSVKHGLTSSADRVVQGLSDAGSVMSGMIWWNTRLKAMAMMEMQHNLVTLMKQYDDLLAKASAGNKQAQLEISKLASVGIGEDQARRIAKMMAKYEPEKIDGIYELEMGRWLDDGDIGNQAYDDVLFALRRVANRGVMTPGVGETPLFMSGGWGKTLMQFQTYGFVVLNRFITPALQRGISYNDMTAVMSMGLAAGLGTAVVGIKDLLRSGEIKERNAGEWAYDILDRSGYLMYLTVPASGAFNLANVAFGLKSAPSRYATQNNQFALLFGPSGNTISDIFGLGYGLTYGNADQIQKHGMKLLPYQILKQVGDRIADQ